VSVASSLVARKRTASDLLAAVWGAVGVFVVGFFGAEALFVPGAEGLAVEVTLLPAIAAAVGAFAYMLSDEAA
jgi:hypothetical protein